ncbi:1,5-anhydro-D-fructose reductase [Hypsibius exemplaris]|uniref:1,5-anhydro-D-fructose reductase n=1 Tax=Hypsibius exemplaris TaxID=2072580 RepID=A0A1W0WNK3_HYPEX|nr:1,5-anhydro-D-fructose reductase [Hypsibius exemplaris]
MYKIPDLTLNNGRTLPIIGLGTWQGVPGEVDRAVGEALKVGYRHFDCAPIYDNEEAIGNILKKAIDGGEVTRDELFITTKLNMFTNEPALVRATFEGSLKALQTGYIDLYLIHLPISINKEQVAIQGMKSPLERAPNPSTFFNHTDLVGIWREFEKLVDEGLVKSIGLSNFNEKQIQTILDHSRIKPANLQVECHPYLPQNQLLAFAKKNNIVLTAYSPLGSPQATAVHRTGGGKVLLQDPVLKKIAERHGKSVAQVLLHWQIQRGVGVLPKSVKRERLEENFSSLSFNLSTEDINEINDLGKEPLRYVDFAAWRDSPDYPFEQPQ